MEDAIVVFSRKGLFKRIVEARDIRSREHARKLWPMVSRDRRRLVTWVRPVFDDDKLLRRSHFRLLPQATYDSKKHFEGEESKRQRLTAESIAHKTAKELIAAELTARIAQARPMHWSFKDPDSSDFPFKGNLLLGATRISCEELITTPFGSSFRLDIAISGPPIEKEPMILGGIEIEFGHPFDGRKALIGKSLGFPLISVDISEMALHEITPAWARSILVHTTENDPLGRRKTYVYLHDLLYPAYAQLPSSIDPEQRHQYLVFSDDEPLQKLREWLRRLAYKLDYSDTEVAIGVVNAKSEQSRKMLENAGRIVGPDWRDFNDHQCLRITLPRPASDDDLKAHRFHMTMARLLLQHSNALVGYQYRNGERNVDPENDIWIFLEWDLKLKISKPFRVLPKRLSEPMSRLMRVVSSLEKPDGIDESSTL